MDLTQMRCMCCGLTGMAPATTTMEREIEAVKVTVEGVPVFVARHAGRSAQKGRLRFRSTRRCWTSLSRPASPPARLPRRRPHFGPRTAHSHAPSDKRTPSWTMPSEAQAVESSNAGTPA